MIRRLFEWWRGSRVSRIPDDLWQEAVGSLPFIACLSEEACNRLRQLTAAFLARKQFSAAGGLELTDAMCINIAAQGCLPVLELGLAAYGEWVEVIVYPDEFVVARQFEDEHGIVHEFDDVLSGEAWPGGPLVISWHDASLAGDGYNVVIHEFAHKLDMQNGDPDGVPPLHSGLSRTEWETVLLTAYEHFCQRVDHDEDTLLDPYAAEHPSEFFAVLTEAFFETPELVSQEYPALYQLFCRYFRQSPLSRLPVRGIPSQSTL